MSNMFDAQYGHTAGGVVNMSIRSGTNDWHGSAYGFFKREVAQRKFIFQQRAGAAAAGRGFGSAGLLASAAPVRIPRLYNGRDRTFFFVSYERSYQGDYITGDSLGSVPTLEQRKGDFSKTFDNSGRLFTIYDPLTGHFEGTNWVRAPFAGNEITPNRFSPVGAKLLNLYPEPNTTTSGSVPWQNNYIAGSNIREWRLNSLIARVDHNFGPRLRLMGRWAWNDFVQLTNNNGLPGVAGQLSLRLEGEQGKCGDRFGGDDYAVHLAEHSRLDEPLGRRLQAVCSLRQPGIRFSQVPGQPVAASYRVPVDLDRRRHHHGPVLREQRLRRKRDSFGGTESGFDPRQAHDQDRPRLSPDPQRADPAWSGRGILHLQPRLHPCGLPGARSTVRV